MKWETDVMEQVKGAMRREWEDEEDDRTMGGFGPKKIQKEAEIWLWPIRVLKYIMKIVQTEVTWHHAIG